jgi:hypothetical protein
VLVTFTVGRLGRLSSLDHSACIEKARTVGKHKQSPQFEDLIQTDILYCNGIRQLDKDSIEDGSLLFSNISQIQMSTTTGSPNTLDQDF